MVQNYSLVIIVLQNCSPQVFLNGQWCYKGLHSMISKDKE